MRRLDEQLLVVRERPSLRTSLRLIHSCVALLLGVLGLLGLAFGTSTPAAGPAGFIVALVSASLLLAAGTCVGAALASGPRGWVPVWLARGLLRARGYRLPSGHGVDGPSPETVVDALLWLVDTDQDSREGCPGCGAPRVYGDREARARAFLAAGKTPWVADS